MEHFSKCHNHMPFTAGAAPTYTYAVTRATFYGLWRWLFCLTASRLPLQLTRRLSKSRLSIPPNSYPIKETLALLRSYLVRYDHRGRECRARSDTTCPAAVFRWENAVLEHIVQTSKFDTGGRSSSADGKRILLDHNDRAVPRLQHLFDDVRAVTTFGMIYPEDVNREVIRVVDSATRKSCLNWHRVFPMTGTRGSLQRSRLPVNWWRSKWKTVFLFTGFLRCGERQE